MNGEYQMGGSVETGNETFHVRTPEHVQLQFVLAGLGSRATAFFLDTACRAILVAGIFFIIFLFSEWLPRLALKDLASGLNKTWILAIGFLAYAAVELGYFLIFEALWNGQTPGKRNRGLRVIRTDGRPVGWLESSIRNILRAVDMFLGVYPLGLVFMFFSKNNQRLGDHAAGTIVIFEARSSVLGPACKTHVESIARPEMAACISRLDAERYRILKSFLDRRGEMDASHRRELAKLLSRQVAEHTGMKTFPKEDEPFLEEIVWMYEQTKRAI